MPPSRNTRGRRGKDSAGLRYLSQDCCTFPDRLIPDRAVFPGLHGFFAFPNKLASPENGHYRRGGLDFPAFFAPEYKKIRESTEWQWSARVLQYPSYPFTFRVLEKA